MNNQNFLTQLLRLREDKVSLDQVAQEVLLRLNLLKASSSFEESLLTAFQRVIHLVNLEADQRLQGQGELSYHNRDHISDVLLALCFLFLNSPNLPREDQLIGLVAMAGHDLGHQGKTNQELSLSQEVLTADLIDKNALSALLPRTRQRISGRSQEENRDVQRQLHHSKMANSSHWIWKVAVVGISRCKAT